MIAFFRDFRKANEGLAWTSSPQKLLEIASATDVRGLYKSLDKSLATCGYCLRAFAE
jgi:hypothetical protein